MAVLRVLVDHWVNPARAGMIRKIAAINLIISGKPRASGDDPRFRRWPACWCP